MCVCVYVYVYIQPGGNCWSTDDSQISDYILRPNLCQVLWRKEMTVSATVDIDHIIIGVQTDACGNESCAESYGRTNFSWIKLKRWLTRTLHFLMNVTVNSLIGLMISQITLFLLNGEFCVKTSIYQKMGKGFENKQLIPSIPLNDLVLWSVWITSCPIFDLKQKKEVEAFIALKNGASYNRFQIIDCVCAETVSIYNPDTHFYRMPPYCSYIWNMLCYC